MKKERQREGKERKKEREREGREKERVKKLASGAWMLKVSAASRLTKLRYQATSL